MALPEDEVLKKYTEMVQGFKKNVEESLQNQSKAWNEVLNNGMLNPYGLRESSSVAPSVFSISFRFTGQKNFSELQKYYGKGHDELIKQMQKGQSSNMTPYSSYHQGLKYFYNAHSECRHD